MNQSIDVIYNRYGEPTLRLLGNGRFVDFDGESIGFLDGQNLYNYDGNHVGWFEKGIMRDHEGACVGFGEYPTDTPVPFLPFKQFIPFASFVESAPFRPFKEFVPFRSFKQFAWSEIEPRDLFFQNI
jgi:4-fold beta flower protein